MKHPRSPKPEKVQYGKVYLYWDGKPYRVGLLNECRARLDPLFRKPRTITDHLHMKTVTIRATPPSISIAPNSELIPLIIR